MLPDDREFVARMELVRYGWEYSIKEAEFHQERLVQLLAVLVAAALTAFASVAFERVPILPGSVLIAGLSGSAAYVHLEIRRVPTRLRAALRSARRACAKLMPRGGR